VISDKRRLIDIISIARRNPLRHEIFARDRPAQLETEVKRERGGREGGRERREARWKGEGGSNRRTDGWKEACALALEDNGNK